MVGRPLSRPLPPGWTWAHHYRVNKVCLLDIVGVSGCSFWVSFSSVQSLSRVQLFATPWTVVRQAFLSITNSQSLLKLMSIESVMPSYHLIPVVPFTSCLQSFPASGSFPITQFFESGGQRIGASASASVLPMNIQD